MSLDTLYNAWDPVAKQQSIGFAIDGRLQRLLAERFRELEKEIADLDPGGTDPVTYTRHAQAMHARKNEIGELMNLLQRINQEQNPQQQKDDDNA